MDRDQVIEKLAREGARQYRQMESVKVLELPDQYIAEGYATTFGEEYRLWGDETFEVREKVDAGAFGQCDMGDVIMQYNHQGRVFARTRNGSLELSCDNHGLHVRADLSGTEIGRQLWQEIKGGYTDRMSFGFSVAKDGEDWIEEKKDGKLIVHRTIMKISKVFDVSAVSLPANDMTEISARSLADVVAARVRDAEKRAQEEARARLQLRLRLMGWK